MSQENNVVMVPADRVVAEVHTAFDKIIGAGTIAKTQGITVGHVKARHMLQHGASGALYASTTGKNRAGVIAAQSDAVLFAMVDKAGNIDFARAMREVVGGLSVAMPYTYTESVRADGVRVVKRAEWLALATFLDAESQKTGKTGKPTPRARAASDALKVWNRIQGHADAIRAMLADASAPKLQS